MSRRCTCVITQRALERNDTGKLPWLRRVQPASAYTGEGIAEGLQWLMQEIRRSQRAVLLRQRAM